MNFFGRAVAAGLFRGTTAPAVRRASAETSLVPAVPDAVGSMIAPGAGQEMDLCAVPKQKRSKRRVKWRRFLQRPEAKMNVMKCGLCGRWKSWKTYCTHKCPGRMVSYL
mmetsp:Transcript_11004/g.33739  ORF Transcript_11004/g.33739 Transcript_11004/m.33739 type:complete len:109 (-) Transcript_11004:158-484(-)